MTEALFEISALAGPGALMRLMDDYFDMPNGGHVWTGVGEVGERQMIVVVKVESGPITAMSIDQARGLARFCRATDGWPAPFLSRYGEQLAQMADFLEKVADQAAVLQRRKLH